jgi:hypothetical protein
MPVGPDRLGVELGGHLGNQVVIDLAGFDNQRVRGDIREDERYGLGRASPCTSTGRLGEHPLSVVAN